MKTLVTGGAGFIGSTLVDALVESGKEVNIIDNLSTGREENLRPGVPFCLYDITDINAMRGTLQHVKPAAVFHLAGQIDVRKSVADPTADALINVLGTINILKTAVEVGVKRFVFSSTGGVFYGEPELLPVEETTPALALCAYGVAKNCAEQYVAYFNRLYGLETTILRYANVFGPRQNPNGEVGVISIFLRQILEGETPTVYGDGEQTRDYVFVKDVVRANLIALEGKPGTYNIGTEVEVSLNELLRTFERILGRIIDVKYLPARLGEGRRIALDASKARKELGWEPKVSFEDGLAETIEWMKKQN